MLQEQKAQQEQDRKRQWAPQFGSNGTPGLGGSKNNTGTSSVASTSLAPVTGKVSGQQQFSTAGQSSATIRGLSQNGRALSESEDGILAAFDSDAPVDKSTNFPAPSGSRAASTEPSLAFGSSGPLESEESNDLDDDPFGLGTGSTPQPMQNAPPQPVQDEDDDDDVLGLLGKPVSEFPPKATSPSVPASSTDPLDKAIAELVEMGFGIEKAQEALAATETGVDTQAAVGWLLNQAHAESREKSQTPVAEDQERNRSMTSRSRVEQPPSDSNMRAWMRQQSRSTSAPRRTDSKSPANGEKDPAKYAVDIGNSLIKTANSLWKTGTQKINKAVSDFNQDADPCQPKWMKEAQSHHEDRASRQRPDIREPVTSPDVLPPRRGKAPDITHEAMMLESGGGRPKSRQKQPSAHNEPKPGLRKASSKMQAQASSRPASASQSRTIQPSGPNPSQSRLSRQVVEDENASAYTSPARRKKATPKPVEPEPDLLFEASEGPAPLTSKQNLRPEPTNKAQTRQPPRTRPSTSIPSRPKPPQRTIPPLSSIGQQSSTSHRLAGTAAFKLGNYAEATTSYSSALRDLPAGHPLTIPLLTNRALTHLKTGDPKACIADADAALQVIGPSRGVGEAIDAGGAEGLKDMVPHWGKAMMRRAEALEQLERWADASAAWRECVEAGAGGSTSIQGRDRCEKAVGGRGGSTSAQAPPRRPASARKKPAPRPMQRDSTLDDLSGGPATVSSGAASTAQSTEAVSRLRAANREAERVDDEKFALADAVDERLARWRKGKEGNLRALLGSLDTVLWEGAGWKKVGMSELIVPGKVKIAYMKGIGKVHPDKVSASLPERRWSFVAGSVCCVVVADALRDTAPDDCDDRADHDQRRGVQHPQRGVG